MTETQTRIIEKAKDVFLTKGLGPSSMTDIGEAAGLVRRSLYRHFPTKEDIAYAVMMSFLREWNLFIAAAFDSVQGQGLYRLESFLGSLIAYMGERQAEMRFFAEYDFIFNDDGYRDDLHVSVADYGRTIFEPDRRISFLLKKGVEDGSIRSDADVELTGATISNVLWSFGQRAAMRGKTIFSETGFDGIDLVNHQLSLYIDALRPVNGRIPE